MWRHSFYSISEAATVYTLSFYVVILWGILSLPTLGHCQQTSSGPKKLTTPQQQALQQQMKAVGATRESLRVRAKQAFDAEMNQEQTGECLDAQGTYQFNICYGKAVGTTDQNLRLYEGAIRDLLNLKYPDLTGKPPMPGPAGPQLEPVQLAAEFDHLEQAWNSYLEAACTAAFHQFGGGTGGPSSEMECHLRIVHSHMRELDMIYSMLLHL